MRRICGAAIALIIAGGGTVARAEVTVSVLGVEPINAPADMAARLADALKRRVVAAPGHELVKGKNLDEIKLVFGCVDEQPDCMSRVGHDLKAQKLLWGTLRASGRGYTLSLRFLDVAGRRLEKSVDQTLTKADAARAAETIAQLTAAIFPPAHGSIRVTSSVIGAEIIVGKAPKGRTERDPTTVRGISPGEHVVIVRKKGYRVWENPVVVTAGETAAVEVRLEALPGVVPPPPPPADREPPRKDPRAGWKIAFWSAAALTVGLGVSVAVTGVSVLDLEQEKRELLDNGGELKTGIAEGTIPLEKEIADELYVDGDACAAAEKSTSRYLDELRTLCSDGETRGHIVNGLVAGGAVTAAVAAFFLYKAYIEKSQDSPAAEDDEDYDEGRSRIRLITGASPRGGHLGLSIEF